MQEMNSHPRKVMNCLGVGNWESYGSVGHVVLGYPDMPNPNAAPRKEDYIHFVDYW